MTVDPHIRPFDDRDSDAVVGLSLRAWAPVFPHIEEFHGSDVFLAMTPDWRASQRETVENALASATIQTWVVEVDEHVAGFVAVQLHAEHNLGEIHLLAVDPEHEGHGLGTALTAFALERIKDAGFPVAMVDTGADPGHAPARRAYEKAGFTLVPVARYFKKL